MRRTCSAHITFNQSPNTAARRLVVRFRLEFPQRYGAYGDRLLFSPKIFLTYLSSIIELFSDTANATNAVAISALQMSKIRVATISITSHLFGPCGYALLIVVSSTSQDVPHRRFYSRVRLNLQSITSLTM